MIYHFRPVTLTTLMVVVLSQCSSHAQGQLVYQNENAEGGWGIGWKHDKVSQPILLGQHDAISSVILEMNRDNGQLDGTLQVELFSDNDGLPDALIGSFGTMDPMAIGTEQGRQYVFDNSITNLSPDNVYHVVLSLSDTTNQSDTAINWGGKSAPGQHTAPEAISILSKHPQDSSGVWHPIRNHPIGGGPPFAIYQTMTARAPTFPCDFNADGACDLDDLDRRTLYGLHLSDGSRDPVDVHIYDITSDDVVNTDDLNAWLVDAATQNGLSSPYLPGDTNLDGAVDFSDFIRVSSNFGKKRRDWSHGDFNGDKEVTFDDFLVLSANFGADANAAVASVPEPKGVYLTLFGILGFVGFCRRR